MVNLSAPKETGKGEKLVKMCSGIENGGEMAAQLFLHLSKTSMVLTCLPSNAPSLSPPPPPRLCLVPPDLPQPLPAGPQKTRPSPIKKRENGTQLGRWRIAAANHNPSHPGGITAMSQTIIQTNWRLMFCLWMVKH